MKSTIIYSVAEIDMEWLTGIPKPYIVKSFYEREQAIERKDLLTRIALADKSKKQYQVVSVKVDYDESEERT